MLCENCGKRKANVQYTQIINGKKKEMHLCEECSEKLGINEMGFTMPINFSSFLSDFIDEFENGSMLPELNPIKELKCDKCNLTFEEFMNTGKFGCSNCYDAFESKIDPILKSIHGSNRHIGRLGKINSNPEELYKNSDEAEDKKEDEQNSKLSEVDKLKEELKEAVSKEEYEKAAKLRDEIKKLEN